MREVMYFRVQKVNKSNKDSTLKQMMGIIKSQGGQTDAWTARYVLNITQLFLFGEIANTSGSICHYQRTII